MTAFLRVLVTLTPLVLGLAPSRAQVPAFDTCGTAVARAADALENAQIARVRETHGRVGHNSRAINPNVDAQRLVNRADWQVAEVELGDRAHLKYTKRTWEAWTRAADFARRNALAPLTPDLLKQINFEAMDGLPLHGFEGRRLRLARGRGELTQDELKARLKDVYERDANPSGVDHRTLVGKFRSDPIDEITHAGSSIAPIIGRYFTPDELNAVRANPHMRLDPTSITEVRPGVIEAVSFYTPPAKVPASVDKVFDTLNRELKTAKRDIDVVRAVARMQKDLVVIHPFLDGNGRSVRLLGDLVLERHGLPPPILISEEEITKSVNEIAGDLVEGMQRYAELTRKANHAKMQMH